MCVLPDLLIESEALAADIFGIRLYNGHVWYYYSGTSFNLASWEVYESSAPEAATLNDKPRRRNEGKMFQRLCHIHDTIDIISFHQLFMPRNIGIHTSCLILYIGLFHGKYAYNQYSCPTWATAISSVSRNARCR